jgi:hypothetical protein
MREYSFVWTLGRFIQSKVNIKIFGKSKLIHTFFLSHSFRVQVECFLRLFIIDGIAQIATIFIPFSLDTSVAGLFNRAAFICPVLDFFSSLKNLFSKSSFANFAAKIQA